MRIIQELKEDFFDYFHLFQNILVGSEGLHLLGITHLKLFHHFPQTFVSNSQVHLSIVLEMYLHADTFLEQSRGALDYYSRMFEGSGEKVLDELYLAGADPLIPLKYFEKGGNNQKNPPLIPELYACV